MKFAPIAGLRAEVWANSSFAERIEALNDLENFLAAEDGRQLCEISGASLGPSTRGQHYYDSQSNEHIDLNSDLINDQYPYQAVETLFHEERHSYQHHVVQNPELANDQAQLKDWQMSEENGYIQPDEINFSTYRWQPTELDANELARSRTDEFFQDTLKDTGQYSNYKNQKEQELSDNIEYAKYELGENYINEAREAMVSKYQFQQELNQEENAVNEIRIETPEVSDYIDIEQPSGVGSDQIDLNEVSEDQTNSDSESNYYGYSY